MSEIEKILIFELKMEGGESERITKEIVKNGNPQMNNTNGNKVSREKTDARNMFTYFMKNKETIEWLVDHKDEIEMLLSAKAEKLEKKNRMCDGCGDETNRTERCPGDWNGSCSHVYSLCWNCYERHSGRRPGSPGRSRYTCKKHT
jgi:phosphoribosylformylglycinamidine (FGAM) synthase-like amidotransferase family enzyme